MGRRENGLGYLDELGRGRLLRVYICTPPMGGQLWPSLVHGRCGEEEVQEGVMREILDYIL